MSNSWLLLGRTGDVISILPFLKHEAETMGKPNLVVSNQHTSVLEGVSYVNAVPFDGGIHLLREGFEFAQSQFPNVKSLQVIGNSDDVSEITYSPAGQTSAVMTSFIKEMWKLAGKMEFWDDMLPLAFDQRNPERESKLVEQFKSDEWVGERPMILVSLKGNSSPFPYCELLMELLRLRFYRQFQIIEMPQAEKIYDLLGLYERAHCLVAVDSAPLHLARACPELPVMALTNDQPLLWHGSSWQPNWAWCCRYHDFAERATGMMKAIETCRDPSPLPFIRVWNAYESSPTEFARCNLPVMTGACGRDSGNTIKDTKRIPYLKDCLRMGLQRAKDDELVCVSRPDTELSQGVAEFDSCYSHRITRDDDSETLSPVVDLFCARKAWWKARLPEIPDLLLGPDYFWSHALWAMFKKHGATDATGLCFRKASERKHFSSNDAPRIAHNRELSAAYVKSSGVRSRYPKVTDQLESLPIEADKLFKHGYNPTIIDRDGRLLMAYRYHVGDLTTKMAMAAIGEDGSVLSNVTLPGNGNSIEDPKFWTLGSKLMLAWVESYFPVKMEASVRYGEFVDGELKEMARPAYGNNDGAHTEKNWVFFGHERGAMFIYQCHPKHIVVRWSGLLEEEYITPGPRWAYGTIKGGTRPVPHGNHLLRFFHSTLDNELTPNKRRYYMGAYLMDSKPPFDVYRVSRKPILYGSEADDLSGAERKACYHWKQNVVFPGGVVERDGHWLVSVGVNDCESVIVKVRPEDLHL